VADDPRITVTEIAGRRRASSGARFEPAVGYSRAVRSGPFITVSGTVGLNADGSYPATIGEQARRALAIIRPATSMVEVSKLVDGALIEIEADAIVA